MFKLAILISGRGSNMESIVKFIQLEHEADRLKNVKVVAVISDEAKAQGLEVARDLGVEAIYLDPGKFKTKLEGVGEDRYIQYLKSKGVNLICLAGFMRVVKPRLISNFINIINIHPSLLPAYPGLNTHMRVIENQDKVTGCTLHWVDEGVDTGEIILQKEVPVLANDTPKTLQRRVMESEYSIYIEGLTKIFQGILPLQKEIL